VNLVGQGNDDSKGNGSRTLVVSNPCHRGRDKRVAPRFGVAQWNVGVGGTVYFG